MQGDAKQGRSANSQERKAYIAIPFTKLNLLFLEYNLCKCH